MPKNVNTVWITLPVFNKEYIKRIIVAKLLKRPLSMSLLCKRDTVDLEIQEINLKDICRDKIFCNINFDDLAPAYDESKGLDLGGNIHKGITLKFQQLLDEFPNVAYTFFTVPSYQFSDKKNDRPNFTISNEQNKEWIDYYQGLASKHNIEYAQHGCFHWQNENKYFNRFAEYAYKTERETEQSVTRGFNILKENGFKVYGFRQPAWDIASDLNLLNVLKQKGYAYIAGCSYDGGLNAVVQRVSNYSPTIINGMINFPQNILLDWNLKTIYERIDKIIEQGGMISIKGHFCPRGMTNAFSDENIKTLKKILDYLKTIKHISYSCLQDLAHMISLHSNYLSRFK